MKRILLALAVVFASTVLPADGLDEIKERMLQRVATIEQLKDKKLLGENKDGYVEFLGPKGSAAGIVQQENKDRRMVYEIIAEQTGASVEDVAQKRAEQIRKRAEPGTWVQDEKGRWVQK